MARVFAGRDLAWDGLTLRLGTRCLMEVCPDPEWPGLYRLHEPGREPSDMVNISRAKDAAVGRALARLNVTPPREA